MSLLSRLFGSNSAKDTSESKQTKPLRDNGDRAETSQAQIDRANAASILGTELYSEQRYAEALPFFENATGIFTKILGADHPHVAQMHINQAAILWKLDRLKEAEQQYGLALAARQKSLGPDHLETAEVHFSIGNFYDEQRRFAEAEDHFLRALAAREKILGPAHILCSVLLFSLGRVNIAKGRYRDAEQLLRRALPLEEATYGPNHKNIGAVLSLLALTLVRQERPFEAEVLFKRVLAIYTEQLGADHPATVQVLRDLARMYIDLGREADANALFEAPRSDDDVADEALPMFLAWLSRFHHRKNYRDYAAAVEFWIRYDAGKHVLASRYAAFGLFCKKVIASGEGTGGLLVRLDADNVAHVPRGSTNAPFLDLAAFNAAVEYSLRSEMS